MKNTYVLLLLMHFFGNELIAQEFKVITSVESIVPLGIGRSRIIDHGESASLEDLTTARTHGTDSNQGSVKRKDAKIDKMEETKLLNFYSGVGINFQNIASNDALISAKINSMISEGWQLAFVVSGVESNGGETDGNGIFITRYIFKRG
ncbi:MAG: hypothetical protein IPL46_20745 [Saprospiraceae bacterium]|nr:hypothetical protein [Saprospiraceae bacterium]